MNWKVDKETRAIVHLFSIRRASWERTVLCIGTIIDYRPAAGVLRERFISHRYDNEYIQRERGRETTMKQVHKCLFRITTNNERFSFSLLFGLLLLWLSIKGKRERERDSERGRIIGPFLFLLWENDREKEREKRENGQLNRLESVYVYSVDAAAERLCSSTSWLWYQFSYSSWSLDIKLPPYSYPRSTGIRPPSGMQSVVQCRQVIFRSFSWFTSLIEIRQR